MEACVETCVEGRWTNAAFRPVTVQLVLILSNPQLLDDRQVWEMLRLRYPDARLVACSTAGEIDGTAVQNDSLVCTLISFDHSTFEIAAVALEDNSDSDSVGRRLASRLPPKGLVHLLVLADGIDTNGSALLRGIASTVSEGVAITGGLAGDADRFTRTAVCVDGPSPSKQVVGIGFYGNRLQVGYGSLGGWDAFGVERKITKSDRNILYELDGEPALALYKKYLGPQAAHLPASGLRFPLAIRESREAPDSVVRTILAVDEQADTMTFAGDMPVGYRARLMSANLEHLLDGAAGAAIAARQQHDETPQLALLISCVGRKLVLNQRVEDEIDVVKNVLGSTTVIAGFYSYGEMAPFVAGGRCEFHNQTMTITTFSEH